MPGSGIALYIQNVAPLIVLFTNIYIALVNKPKFFVTIPLNIIFSKTIFNARYYCT